MKLARVVFVQSHSVVDHMDHVEGVHLRQLPPLTTLLVRTTNSLYRIVVTEGSNVYIQGGAFFPDPTSAHLDGATIGGSLLNVGWIHVGFLMQIRAGGRRILTSPIRAITIEGRGTAVVH